MYFKSNAAPKPVWSAQIGGLEDFAIAGPAISICAHEVPFSTKHNKNAAAVLAPPYLVLPMFTMSPNYPFILYLCSSVIGKCHTASNDSSLAASISLTKFLSFEKRPAVSSPKATIQAPVRVAKSMIYLGLNCC